MKGIGIVRVSRIGGRDDIISPAEQRARLDDVAAREGIELLRVTDELDVSGGTPLERRTGLREAVEAIERGEAKVLMVPYFDRLARSLKVQEEVVRRVEEAGGRVLAADIGEVTEGTAGQWLSGTLLGAVNEYQRRSTKERVGEALRRAVERGAVPLANIVPGYRRGPQGKLVVEPREAPVVREAFELRADGQSVADIAIFMCDNGIDMTRRRVEVMLKSRLVLGEIVYGKEDGQMHLINATAHEAIVDRDTWRRAQAVKASPGRKSPSPLLLSRLGVLRCGTCGKHLSMGRAGQHATYRCLPTAKDQEGKEQSCEQRVVISARVAHEVIEEAVRTALADREGRASAAVNVRQAVAKRDECQAKLDSGIKSLADFPDEPATRETLEKLREARDAAQERVDAVGGADAAETVNVAEWESAPHEIKRDLIRALVARAIVSPASVHGGRGARGRITIEPH